MSKILFFNSFQIIDSFLIDRVEKKDKEIIIVRSIFDLEQQFTANRFDFLFLNIDDQIDDIPHIVELSMANNSRIKVVVFGQYKDYVPMLEQFDMVIFLSECPIKEEFDLIFDNLVD